MTAAVLVTEFGRFDRAAIIERAKAIFEPKRSFIDRYQGDARIHWRTQLWGDAVRRAYTEAREQKHALIWPHVKADYELTEAEQREVERLEGIQRFALNTYPGQQMAAQARHDAAVIRENAMNRKYREVERRLEAGELRPALQAAE